MFSTNAFFEIGGKAVYYTWASKTAKLETRTKHSNPSLGSVGWLTQSKENNKGLQCSYLANKDGLLRFTRCHQTLFVVKM